MNKPPPGKKRIGEWKGMRVRFTAEVSNGVTRIPAGFVATVRYVRCGLTLVGDPCSCCGVSVYIRKVPTSNVEPLGVSAERGEEAK